jgi:hypothetical protein
MLIRLKVSVKNWDRQVETGETDKIEKGEVDNICFNGTVSRDVFGF